MAMKDQVLFVTSIKKETFVSWFWLLYCFFFVSGPVTPCRNSSSSLGVRSPGRGVWLSAPLPTSSQRFAYKHIKKWSGQSTCLWSLISLPPQARAGEYVSILTGSVISTLLDAGLVFLLRFALDDGVEGVMSAAVQALKALLVCAEDEVSPP